MLHFNPETGLYADEVEAVRAAVRSDWQNAFAQTGKPALTVEPETPAGQLIDSQTAAIVDKDNEVLFLANQFNPLTAQGIWQDALGKIYFLTRKVAQPAVASCVCMGLPGTVIAQNSVIKSSADNSQWLCMASATIPASGSATVNFQSSEAGAVTAAANTLDQIVTVTPGWDSVNNPTAATAGIVEETQAEFEARRFASVAANAHGSVAAIYGALADLEGVLDAVVLENTTNEPIAEWGVTIPGHSVFISVVGGQDADIASVIYSKKDAGCGTAGNTQVTYQDTSLPWQPIYTYSIERPAPLPIGVKVSLKLTSATAQNIEQLVKQAVLNSFNGTGATGQLRVGMAQILYASRFYCPVIAAGVQDLLSIEIAAPVSGGVWTDSVTINADQTPTLDEADIEVVIVEAE